MLAKRVSDLHATIAGQQPAPVAKILRSHATTTESAAALLSSLAKQIGELQAAMAKLQASPPASTQDRNLSWPLPSSHHPAKTCNFCGSQGRPYTGHDAASCWSKHGVDPMKGPPARDIISSRANATQVQNGDYYWVEDERGNYYYNCFTHTAFPDWTSSQHEYWRDQENPDSISHS
jgi:hypothetical protein